MKNVYQSFMILGLLAGTAAAQSPAFTGIVNPASNIPPGLPNSSIAQGSIFVVYGSNLGPSTLVQATTLPLPTAAGLARNSAITIAQGSGTPVAAPMVYTSAGQVAAIMPSNAPAGIDTLTLTYNGNSASARVGVVVSNFGISTVAQSGTGAAVVTFADCNSLVHGHEVCQTRRLLAISWGTGLGPITGSDALGAAGGNLPALIQVFVGGVQASVQYQGRTPTAVGLDQINITVPQNVPTGCWVPIIVRDEQCAKPRPSP